MTIKGHITLWGATSRGRVFISKNADTDPASAVTFTRIDIATSPNRYISEIAVDPGNANHAWIRLAGHLTAANFQQPDFRGVWAAHFYGTGVLRPGGLDL